MINSSFVMQAFSGDTVKVENVAIQFRTQMVGDLEIISGFITACDPFVETATNPFTQKVPTGTFPLSLAIARFDNNDERVAFARVDFSNHPIAFWRKGLVLGKEVSENDDVETIGYPVDSGAGCFMDAKVAVQLDQRFYAEQAYFDETLALCLRTESSSWTVANVRPDLEEPGNMITFSSGWGEGVYASYFGHSAQGILQCLITDFEIVAVESEAERAKAEAEYHQRNRAKPWWKLW